VEVYYRLCAKEIAENQLDDNVSFLYLELNNKVRKFGIRLSWFVTQTDVLRQYAKLIESPVGPHERGLEG
jgi:hypothetical protein